MEVVRAVEARGVARGVAVREVAAKDRSGFVLEL